MSDTARRTRVELTFEGQDITKDINLYFISLTYTDNEADETDDLQLKLDDREGIWLGSWLNSASSKTDNIKGAEITATIIKENWNSDGLESELYCGAFEVDSVTAAGPPGTVTIKGTSIPYTSTFRSEKKTQAWESFKLSAIAGELASRNGLSLMYESSYDPEYKRREQLEKSDIVFLQELAKEAGLSLKVTDGTVVLFDAAEYEQKEAVQGIARGQAYLKSYSFSTEFTDTAYTKCTVSYTDTITGTKYSGTFAAPGASGDGQELKVNERVSSNAEAKTLAEKRLREKNSQEYKASFSLAGDTGLVAGLNINVSGWGVFDGRYIIETATHSVSRSGYTTSISCRRTLEGY